MNRKSLLLQFLNHAPVLLFSLVFVIFGLLSNRFFQVQNLENILVQSSSIAVAAVGMTFVLLTAGVDLSVGSIMFVTVAVAGKLLFNEQPLFIAFGIGTLVGVAAGAINAVLITRLKVIAFIATLAMLFVLRGFGLWLTNTRAMNMPDAVTALGASKVMGVPLPVLILFLVALVAHVFLKRTPWGRQIYAIGCDIDAARTAGIRVDLILFMVYVLSGVCAAVSGLIALSQTGAVSPGFGQQREFSVIAAAVLGGTSLFGGRGNILPGTLFGAILFQTVENGLVIIDADPYIYPIILGGIVFLTVLLDTVRQRLVQNLTRRQIRVTHTS